MNSTGDKEETFWQKMTIPEVWGLLPELPSRQAFLQLAPFLRVKVLCLAVLMITE